jgi:hypothetical protein
MMGQNIYFYYKFRAFTAVVDQMMIFWLSTPCSAQGRKLKEHCHLIDLNFYFIRVLTADPSGRAVSWVFGRLLTRIVGLNPTGGMDVCFL